jgi:hypothetical protein
LRVRAGTGDHTGALAPPSRDERPYTTGQSAGCLVSVSIDLVTPEVRHRPNSPRGPVFIWGNVVVLSWLAVAVALLAIHDALGLTSWIALHALLLGAVTTAIVVWSEHFAVALCRMPSPPARRLALGLTALTVFVVPVLAGVSADISVLTGVGGTGIAVIRPCIPCIYGVPPRQWRPASSVTSSVSTAPRARRWRWAPSSGPCWRWDPGSGMRGCGWRTSMSRCWAGLACP